MSRNKLSLENVHWLPLNHNFMEWLIKCSLIREAWIIGKSINYWFSFFFPDSTSQEPLQYSMPLLSRLVLTFWGSWMNISGAFHYVPAIVFWITDLNIQCFQSSITIQLCTKSVFPVISFGRIVCWKWNKEFWIRIRIRMWIKSINLLSFFSFGRDSAETKVYDLLMSECWCVIPELCNINHSFNWMLVIQTKSISEYDMPSICTLFWVYLSYQL